jgi:hypothetical protein
VASFQDIFSGKRVYHSDCRILDGLVILSWYVGKKIPEIDEKKETR